MYHLGQELDDVLAFKAFVDQTRSRSAARRRRRAAKRATGEGVSSEPGRETAPAAVIHLKRDPVTGEVLRA